MNDRRTSSSIRVKSDAHVDITARLRQFSKLSASDLFALGRTALSTFRRRYLQRIAGRGTLVGYNTTLRNGRNIRIGAHCLIQDHVYMRAGTDGWIEIGDHAAINSFARLFGHGGVRIGEHSQVGPGSLITTTGHDHAQAMAVEFRPVTIGRNVWIGANCTILSGVEIGDGSIIGAGAVVNRSVPPNSLAVGVPARIVRKLTH